MKKSSTRYLGVLLFGVMFEIACGATSEAIIWGPENGGLRMNLQVVPAESNQPDIYKVTIRIANVGKSPTILVAKWEGDHQKGDYRQYIKESVFLESFPEIRYSYSQTWETQRTLPQPTIEVKPGDFVAAEWITVRMSLVPQGDKLRIMDFPSNGLYGIRARFHATLEKGGSIPLYSNDCQLAVGGSTAVPKTALSSQPTQCPTKTNPVQTAYCTCNPVSV
jgi:hypothetical protein